MSSLASYIVYQGKQNSPSSRENVYENSDYHSVIYGVYAMCSFS